MNELYVHYPTSSLHCSLGTIDWLPNGQTTVFLLSLYSFSYAGGADAVERARDQQLHHSLGHVPQPTGPGRTIARAVVGSGVWLNY